MSVASTALLSKLGLSMKDARRPPQERLYAANDTRIEVLGKLNITISYEGNETNEEILICNTAKDDVLLSWKCCQRLKIIPQDFPKPI